MRKASIVATTLLLALIAAGVIAYFVFKGRKYTLYIEKGQIQEAIDKKMPYERSVARIFVLRVKNTRVLLAEGSDRIGASTDVELNVKINDKPRNFRGFVQSRTGIKYDQESFCFYLRNPEIEELRIQGIPGKYTRAVSRATKTIVQKYINDVPVYRIKDNTMKMRLAKALLKDVEVVNGRLALTLRY